MVKKELSRPFGVIKRNVREHFVRIFNPITIADRHNKSSTEAHCVNARERGDSFNLWIELSLISIHPKKENGKGGESSKLFAAYFVSFGLCDIVV